MTILELEQRTQLDRATIRYYEREGLITPKRKENSYRDYSEDNAEEILKIKLFRQLDISIDTIKRLQKGDADVSAILRQQAVTLENQIAETGRAAKICKEISASEIRYSDLNATPYLDKLKEEFPSPESESQLQIPYERQAQYIEYHPVRRLVARILDYTLLEVLITFIIIVVFRVRPYSKLMSNAITYGCLLLSVPLQALMIRYLATTPGKWLMGIHVQAYNGKKMDIDNAMLREWHALFYGYGLGIPLIRLWRLWRSYKVHRAGDPLEQDIGAEHVYADWNVRKKSAFTLICVLILFINFTNVLDAIKPHYRGNNLTIAEFAENYNYYTELFEYRFTMNPDGTWYISDDEETGNVIITNPTTPEKENEPFRFTTEGENVKQITYQNAWTDIFSLKPISMQIIIASFTAIASQKGLNTLEALNAINYIEKYADDETAEIKIDNIEIRWSITSVNCYNSNGTYFAKDKAKESSVSLFFEIIIQ